ncbi:MAG: TIGR00730 family Rossman fold protein [Sphingomonadales bacterium]
MKQIKSLCIYCGSRTGVENGYAEAAEELGTILAENGVRLIFGGGAVGLMGVVARSVLESGGEVIGVIPEHLHRTETGFTEVTQLITVETMHQRKQKMFELADAFAALPGGVGTLDEAFEMITWRQLGLHSKPIVLLDIDGYWQPFQALMANITDAGFASAKTNSYYKMVGGVDDVLPAVHALNGWG